MPTAEAHVRTDRPERYLVQLCKHASQMGQHTGRPPRTPDESPTHTPPEMQHAEWSDTRGVVRMNWGQWTVHAVAGTLILRVEAANENSLQQIQAMLGGRLEKIGRRDDLTVAWQPSDTPTIQPGDSTETERSPDEPQPARHTSKRRPHIERWLLVAVVAVVVAVHLGLAGAALAATQWTDWTAIGLVAIFLGKLVIVRLIATRRGHTSPAPHHILHRMVRDHTGHRIGGSRVADHPDR